MNSSVANTELEKTVTGLF